MSTAIFRRLGRKSRHGLAAVAILVVFVLAANQEGAAAEQRPLSPPEAIARLRSDTDGTAEISINRATGMASFIRLPETHSLPLAHIRGSTPETAIKSFFNQYGAALGIQDAQGELTLEKSESLTLVDGVQLTYQQMYEDVPVFAAVIKARTNENNQVTSVNGTFVPGIALAPTTPMISREEAQRTAIDAVAIPAATIGQRQKNVGDRQEDQGTSADLAAANSHLTVFRSGLVQGIPGEDYLAYEVEVVNSDVSLREFVFVDAQKGGVIARYSDIQHDLRREVSNGDLANVVWSEGDDDPLPPNWAGGSAKEVESWQDELDGARETYNLFASMAGWDSYDNAGAMMRTLNISGSACPNAFWNGISTNFCVDVTADDTVAHEWAHAYTMYSSNLIYWWQSGALNESYSDIWGETVDLLNGRGEDTPDAVRPAATCSSNATGANLPGHTTLDTLRWLAGEDNPAFEDEPQGSGNALRDMWEPACFGDPGKVTDTEYRCGDEDNGGIHSNSGVPNHAFALMVDGGTYNGQTISGIGLTRAAHIHWAAQMMLTPASNFADHADALEAACSALIGIELPALSTTAADAGLADEVILEADCQEVAKAVAAVELRTPPDRCHFRPLLAPDAPPLCEGMGDRKTFFFEDWETGSLPAGWNVGTRNVANQVTFNNPDWRVTGDLPEGAKGSFAAFVPNDPAGNCIDDDKSGVLYLESPAIEVPEDIVPRAAFDHWLAIEHGWDGGNLKISVNDGPWTLVEPSRFEFNTYIDYIYIFGNHNPLAGQAAFTGADGGENFGSWGQSQVNLHDLATPGDVIRFRFELGLDECGGAVGWYVDDFELYSCSAENNLPPDNDEFASAIDILKSPFAHRESIRTATVAADDPALPCGPDNKGRGTVWYKLRSEQDTVLTADTFGSGYDTVLVVWEGTSDNLREMACNDDAVGWQSQVTDVALDGGKTYYIEVAAYDGDKGTLKLNVDVSPPGNDDFSAPDVVSALPDNIVQSAQWATTASDDPVLPCGPGNPGYGSLWYAFTPEQNVQLTANTYGSTYDTVLVIWEGQRGALTPVACDDDSKALQSKIEGVTLEQGVTYWIEAAGFSSSSGMLQLNVDSLSAPANDNLENATQITSSPFGELQNVAGATSNAADPVLPCGPHTQGYGSVWYQLIPQEDVGLTADTIGSNYDTVLTVWQESSGNLSAIACNDDSSGLQSRVDSVALARNRTYYIEVAAYNNSLGVLQLSVNFEPYVPVNHDIRLVPGWNMISSYVWPNIPEMASLVNQIENDLILIKNGAGEVYWPELQIDNIGDWSVRQGYQVYVSSAQTLSFSGFPIDTGQTSIELRQGWNLVPYLLDVPLPVEQALAGISDKLILVKNGAGDSYWPTLDINDIGQMQPGEAYQIRVSSNVTLYYPNN